MKKTLIALSIGTFGFVATAQAVQEGIATATWQATAKKDTTSELVVTPLSNLSFQYDAGNKTFNTLTGLFDVAINGDPDSTAFTLKAKKLNGTLHHLSGDSTVDVGVKWGGTPVITTSYITLVDTAAGISGGHLAPLTKGFKGESLAGIPVDGQGPLDGNDADRASAQASFTFNIESATVNGKEASFEALPDGQWSGEVNVEFVANWV